MFRLDRKPEYWKVDDRFDAKQIVVATWIFKQHCCMGTVAKVEELMHLQEVKKNALSVLQ